MRLAVAAIARSVVSGVGEEEEEEAADEDARLV